MASNTRRAWCAAVVGGLALVGLLGGCSDKITAKSVRANMSPELESIAMTHEQRLNVHARANDTRNRMLYDDIDYLLLIDQPPRLSKYPIPEQSVMDSPQLPFTMRTADGVQVIEFRHDLLDPFEVERSNQELHMMVESTRHPRCVVSLANVNNITSKLLGIIMGLDIKILRKRGQLRICNINPRVYEVFALTRLHEILHIDSNTEAAMQNLA